MAVRTQIYLRPEQHRALAKAAREQHVSMTELLRRLIDRHVLGKPGVGRADKEAVLSFVGLGESGEAGISEEHDAALDAVLRR